jgi:hypothetical protein
MRVVHACWSLLAFAWLLPQPLQAQDKPEQAPLTRAELDARLNRQLYLATVAGVTTFNAPNNDPAGCARIFQGALITASLTTGRKPRPWWSAS